MSSAERDYRAFEQLLLVAIEQALEMAPNKREAVAASVREIVGRKLISLRGGAGVDIGDLSTSLRQQLQVRALKLLNELVEADRDAMQKLVEFRVEVNEKVMGLDSPVVVMADPGKPNLLGVVGLINGILGCQHRIEGIYDEDGTKEGRLVKFRPHPQPVKAPQVEGDATS